MGRPLRADGQKTRQAILDAALQLFADRGYFGTSLRDIARLVGVRESALYNYFTSKEALFNALIAAAHEQRVERLSEVTGESAGTARVALERLTRLVLGDFCAPRAQQVFGLLMSDGLRLARQGRLNLIDHMTSGAAPLHALMRRLVADGSLKRIAPELLALEFMGPLLMWRHWHAVDPTGPLMADRDAFVHAHVEHFLQGAGAAPVRSGVRRAPRAAATARSGARPSRVAG